MTPCPIMLVDTSVWIDFFRDRETPEVALLSHLLDNNAIVMGDLILMEILQGIRHEREYRQTKELLLALTPCDMVNQTLAIQAADNYRRLRQSGQTIRKSVDVLIATYCIEHNLPLLFSDRDFHPFVDQLGLLSGISFWKH